MNKELIKKYREEFNHWLDGGDIQVLWSNINGSKWEKPIYFDWDEPECAGGSITAIVINDKYVEFRKAICEGKTVQEQQYTHENVWTDFELPYVFALPVEQYRIKPDEPEFSVGDYVKYKGIKGIALVKEVRPDGKLITSNFGLSLPEELKLWTIEDADDDEWVYTLWNNGLCQLGTVKEAKVDSEKESVKTHGARVWVKPFCNQTPAQLGLEK